MVQSSNDSTDGGVVTWDQSAVEDILESFGWRRGPNGYVQDRGSGAAVLDVNDQRIKVEDVAGIVEKDGRATPLRDNFVDLVNYGVEVDDAE